MGEAMRAIEGTVAPAAEPGRPLLAVEGVTLRFGGVTALQDVNFTVGPDELVALIGPNGAGKSSLLNCLSGFYRPQSRAASASTGRSSTASRST